jgi:hypothetical protein
MSCETHPTQSQGRPDPAAGCLHHWPGPSSHEVGPVLTPATGR